MTTKQDGSYCKLALKTEALLFWISSQKRRIYHVPFLLHAEIMQQAVYIFTSNSKIMRLNLLTATRQFLSEIQLKYLTKIRETHQSLCIKDTVNKNVKHR